MQAQARISALMSRRIAFIRSQLEFPFSTLFTVAPTRGGLSRVERAVKFAVEQERVAWQRKLDQGRARFRQVTAALASTGRDIYAAEMAILRAGGVVVSNLVFNKQGKHLAALW